MNILAVIPARYASTRFPGKPLVDIQGKPMIQRVYESVKKSELFAEIVVATDDERIVKVAEGFGAQVILTSEKHESGTDRCGEVISKLQYNYDIVVNIQGDEPMVNPLQLKDNFLFEKQEEILNAKQSYPPHPLEQFLTFPTFLHEIVLVKFWNMCL